MQEKEIIQNSKEKKNPSQDRERQEKPLEKLAQELTRTKKKYKKWKIIWQKKNKI